MRQIWDRNDRLYEGQMGLDRDSHVKVISVPGHSGLFDEGVGVDAIILDFHGSQSNLRCDARERFGPTTVSSYRKWYLEEQWPEY
jgi:hypothetical protein